MRRRADTRVRPYNRRLRQFIELTLISYLQMTSCIKKVKMVGGMFIISYLCRSYS